MKKIPLLIVFIVALLTNACFKEHDPEPNGAISSMEVSAKRVNDDVIVDIVAYTDNGQVGPTTTTFDAAEIWIAEDVKGYANMELAYTTTQTSLKLENLKPDKDYYVAVKGIKNGKKTGFSKYIMFVNRSLKPTSTLFEMPAAAVYYIKSSSTRPYVAYLDNTTGEVILQNWQDKSKQVIVKNTDTKVYQVRGFYAEGSRLFLETSNPYNHSERAFEYYDLSTEKFVAVELPTRARVWNYAFSADASKLAYTDYSRQGLYIYDMTTKEDKRYLSDSFYSFEWSADGKNIYMIRNKAFIGPPIAEIVKYDITNAAQEPTPLFEWRDETMAWVMLSPKEEYILFASYISNSPDLWIFEFKTKKFWQISGIVNFGWLSAKEFFVTTGESESGDTYKTYKYTMP